MVVDCHVHGRDFKEKEKETIEHALEVASISGLDGVVFMPNTIPHLTTPDLVREYLKLGEQAETKDVYYSIFMGITSDEEQIKHAVGLYHELHPRIAGFKLYMEETTNPEMSVTELPNQYTAISTLASLGYNGVLALHAGKQNLVNDSLFDPENPITHSTLARPELGEIEGIEDAIKIIKEVNYKGKIDFKHVSTPRGIEIIKQAREEGTDAVAYACPHHLFTNRTIMNSPDGLQYKMNPPLRSPDAQKGLMHYLRQGDIHGIETDHAPHGKRKNPKDCPSGVKALHAWPLFIEYLKQNDFSEKQIEDLTHNNIVSRHGLPIENSGKKGTYHPNTYSGFNEWSFLARQLNRD